MEGATGIRGNHLDPGAQEYYPAGQIALAYPQIYYPYPPPPPPAPAAAVVPAYHHHQLSQPQQYAIPPQAAGDGPATRAVVLSMVPPHVGEGAVRAEMEAFGGVRAVEMGAVAGEGTVAVHFYDLRSAQAAVAVVREQHVRQQSRLHGVPTAAGNWDPWDPEAGGGPGLLLMHPYQQQQQQMGGPGLIAGHAVWAQFAARELEGPNQGSLVVFNCDPAVSSAALGEIFQAFGDVKAVREAPSKPHKFVEFFDIRDAARALSELDGKEILGRRLVVEFSRLGGGGSGSQARRSGLTFPYKPQLWFLGFPTPNTNNRSSSSSSFYKRTPSHQKNSSLLPPRLLRTTSDPSRWSQVRGDAPHPPSPTLRGLPGASAPSSSLKRSNAGADTAGIGNTRGGGGAGRRNKSGINPSASTSSSSPSSSSSKLQQSSSGNSTNRKGWKSHPKNSGDARFLFKEGAAEESSSSSPSTCSARDSRTTVMIKNIPNKYSQKLLLNMLDNHCIHCNEQIGDGGGDDEPFSAYDFVYLPIDFNNKCNVGYGFVNLTTPEATLRLYKAFHMQPWEVFNSRKICQVTYARLQGLEALKEHFKNSKFACDNDDYLPVVFSPPRDGRQLTDPDPIGGRVCSSKRAAVNLSLLQAGGGDPGAQPADDGAASTTTTSTHAPSDQADGGDDEEHDDDEVTSEGAGGSDGTGSGLSAALRRLSYNQD